MNLELAIEQEVHMGRAIAIGIQDFGDLRKKQCFYVDKTAFIKEWWESEDTVTLIAPHAVLGKHKHEYVREFLFGGLCRRRGSV